VTLYRALQTNFLTSAKQNNRRGYRLGARHDADRSDDCRRYSEDRLVDCNDQDHDSHNVFSIALRDQWRQRRQVADTHSKKNATECQQQPATAQYEEQNTGGLNAKIERCSDATVTIPYPPASERAPHHGTE
jgi:hypothetical protein